jgi:hypothetical protein
MTTCACGHQAHHHNAEDGECHTVTITGPATTTTTADANLHIGRTATHCPCRSLQPGDKEQQ